MSHLPREGASDVRGADVQGVLSTQSTRSSRDDADDQAGSPRHSAMVGRSDARARSLKW
jgi:hypothetical protein